MREEPIKYYHLTVLNIRWYFTNTTPRRGCSLLELPESVDKKRDSACRIEDWANQPGARKVLLLVRRYTQ